MKKNVKRRQRKLGSNGNSGNRRLVLKRNFNPGFKTVILLLLAATLILQSMLYSAGTSELRNTISHEWRGPYDILVLPEGEDFPSYADDYERELLDPNFANITWDSKIPRQAYEKVAALDGVEFVAPIGFLARLGNTMEWPTVSVPLEIFDSAPIQGFEFDVVVTTTDGIGDRISQSYINHVVIDTRFAQAPAQESGLVEGIEVASTYSVGHIAFDGFVKLSLFPLPVVASTIFAVDPAQEMKLLGEKGTFVKPLLDFDAALRSSGAQTRIDINESKPSEAKDLMTKALSTKENSLILYDSYGENAPLAPYIRNVDAYPPMDLSVSIRRSERNPKAATLAEALLVDASSMADVGASTISLSERLRPFSHGSFEIPWPGESETLPNYFVSQDQPSTVSGLDLRPTAEGASQGISWLVVDQGFVRAVPDDDISVGQQVLDGRGVGQTQTYRMSEPMSDFRVGTKAQRGAAPIEVGTYDATSLLTLGSSDDYAPLGAYNPTGVYVDGHEMQPTLNGLGLAAQSSTAITTLDGAKTLGIEEPITALRVKVAGIDNYSSESVRQITDIAQQITQLGLKTYVVAGSSQQQVSVSALNYAFGTTNEQISQTVGNLDSAELTFTTLGVATSAESAATKSLSTIGLVLPLLLCLAYALVVALSRKQTTSDASVLRQTGFTRTQSRYWFLEEDAVGLLAVLGSVVVVCLLSTALGSAPHLIMAFVCLVLVVVISIGNAIYATQSSLRSGSDRMGSNRSKCINSQLPESIVGLYALFLRWQSSWMILRALCLALIAVSVAVTVELLVSASIGLRTTILGALLADSVNIFLVIFGAIAACAGIIVYWVVARAQTSARTDDLIIFDVVLMWSRKKRLLVPLVEHQLTGLLACVILGIVMVSLDGVFDFSIETILMSGVSVIALSVVSFVSEAKSWARDSGYWN